MAEHTITLTEAQEDALLTLTERQQLAQERPELTTADVLAALVTTPLAVVEQEQEAAKATLREAATHLPQHLLARIVQSLTPAQRRDFDFLFFTSDEREERRGQ